MLSFYCSVCKVQWPIKGQVQVYYGDTDSLLLKVKTENLLEDLENGVYIGPRMDYTNWIESIYPELVKRQAPNQLLMLKSETGSDLLSNGVFPGPKVYSVETHDKDVKQACKGVPTHFVKNNFDMSVYRNCVDSCLVPRGKVLEIRSLQYKNYTVRVEKNATSCISDKVYVLENDVRVLPHGHYQISDRVECVDYRNQLGLDKLT